jgi:hypothetical protein
MLFSAFQIISQIVKSNHGLKIAVLFTLRESRGRRISCVVKGSGFAVGYYSFTLDALDLQHPRLLQH